MSTSFADLPNDGTSGDSRKNRQRLSGFAVYVLERMTGLRLGLRGTPREDVLTVAVTLLRAITVQAAAVAALGDTTLAEASAANVRTMVEGFAELRRLFEGNVVRNARLAIAYQWLELKHHLSATNADAATHAPVDRALVELPQVDPSAFDAAVAQRGRRKWHWSGLTRSQLVDWAGQHLRLGDQSLRDAYRLFSWDSHLSMGAIRDTREIDIDGEPVMHYASWRTPDEAAEANANAALQLLFASWRTFCEGFGLDVWAPLAPSQVAGVQGTSEQANDRESGASG